MIRIYRITSTRLQITPSSGGTPDGAGGWTPFVPATFDHPQRTRTEVLADHKAGRPTPGDEVSFVEYGVGTTVKSASEYRSRGWDDGDNVTVATYRDEAGVWREVDVFWDPYSGSEGNELVVDAPADVVEAWRAHEEAEYQKHLAAQAAQREKDREEKAARERATVDRGRFVVVARGRKVPTGTVGRVFHLSASEWGERAGLATSTRTKRAISSRGFAIDAAEDVAWSPVANLDVLLAEMPESPAEVELLYRCAAAVCEHARVRMVEEQKAALAAAEAAGQWAPSLDAKAPVVDTFTALWRWAVERPERLGVMLAYSPSELPRIDAETPRSLEEVCEAVESMDAATAVGARLAGIALGWSGSVEERHSLRSLVEPCLGVIYVAPAPKARRTRKAVAA